MKTILITGVSRGIGKALAEKFLSNGDFVIGTSTDGKIQWNHENLTVLSLDLSKSESIANAATQIRQLGKTLDSLINNAAILFDEENKLDQDINLQFLRKTLEVNVIGTIDFTQRVVNLLKPAGHVINVSSRMGSLQQIKVYNDPSYRISKTALNMFTQLLALKLQDKAIVSSLHPGWVQTDMGGMEADRTPQEAAEDIFNLANSKVETGQFWFKGDKFPW